MPRSVFRKPSIKKSLAAKYKGAYTRKLKKSLIPGYGTKTAGWLHPKRKLYNKIYCRTSIDTRKVIADALTKKNEPITSSASTKVAQGKTSSGFLDFLLIILTAIFFATGHFILAIILICLIVGHVINGEKQESEQK